MNFPHKKELVFYNLTTERIFTIWIHKEEKYHYFVSHCSNDLEKLYPESGWYWQGISRLNKKDLKENNIYLGPI